MTTIFSAISGHFSKSLFLGTFLPVTFFVIFSLIFVVPIIPYESSLLISLQSLDIQWRLLTIVFIIVAFSGLLFNLNVPIVRLYQGYSWKDSWVGKLRTQHYQRLYYAAEGRWSGMRTLLLAMKENDTSIKRVQRAWAESGQRVNHDFPRDIDLVMPTSLGNVIRSFEDYPFRRYGMESITLWPRLIAKIDKDYAVAMDEAKVSFDFTLNISILSSLLAVSILVVGLRYPTALSQTPLLIWWLFEVIIFLIIASWFYQLSIGRAKAWGSMFKGSFDLYRWDLLKQLGFEYKPRTMAEERLLWKAIHQQMIYGDTPVVKLADYKQRHVFVMTNFQSGIPSAANYLEATRGISIPGVCWRLTVTIKITNTHPRQKVAKDVIVTDTLPDGFEYEWNSAQRVDGLVTGVKVEGINPLQFHLGDVEKDVVLVYHAILYQQKAQNDKG